MLSEGMFRGREGGRKGGGGFVGMNACIMVPVMTVHRTGKVGRWKVAK